MRGFSVRLTHRIMAIGAIGLTGLLTVGVIYELGNRSQDASRATAMNARAIADLNKQLSIEMLEARRNEKNFQQRRNESYAKAHAELVVAVNRDFDRLSEMTRAAGMNALADKVRLAHEAFKSYAADFAAASRAPKPGSVSTKSSACPARCALPCTTSRPGSRKSTSRG